MSRSATGSTAGSGPAGSSARAASRARARDFGSPASAGEPRLGSGRDGGRAGRRVVGGDEEEQREVREQADAAGQGRHDEADADQDRVQAEVGREATGHAGELLVGRGAGQGADGGLGGGGVHETKGPASGAAPPLGMTLTAPSIFPVSRSAGA